MTDNEALIERIKAVSFTPTRLTDSYDMVAVDDFLDGLVATLRLGRAIEPLIDMVRFGTVRFREGYSTQEVDDFLAGLAAEASGGPAAIPDLPPEVETPPVPVSYAEAPRVVSEQRGLLSRLFRR